MDNAFCHNWRRAGLTSVMVKHVGRSLRSWHPFRWFECHIHRSIIDSVPIVWESTPSGKRVCPFSWWWIMGELGVSRTVSWWFSHWREFSDDHCAANILDYISYYFISFLVFIFVFTRIHFKRCTIFVFNYVNWCVSCYTDLQAQFLPLFFKPWVFARSPPGPHLHRSKIPFLFVDTLR